MFLGIDTSCYTTSLAVVDERKKLLAEKRIILPVSMGKQGLRQSTALFYHLQNLPQASQKLFSVLNGREIKAIAVSARPLPRENSYLPVFVAGLSIAESLSVVWDIPLIKTSHQEGHIMAGIWACKEHPGKEFLALHLSGGTTELLLVQEKQQHPLKYESKVLGASQDLHAGQLVDRVGVALGLPFPAGRHFEKLAAKVENKTEVKIPSAVQGYKISFSGAETQAKKFLKQGISPQEIARAVEDCLAVTVEKVVRRAIEETGVQKVLFVGGVMANTHLRQRLRKRLEHPAVNAQLYFPQPEFNSDNAVGVSLIARSAIF
ncbi:MAG: O-sialoglycoprotein endopeptidase [Peptococcia bacterium]